MSVPYIKAEELEERLRTGDPGLLIVDVRDELREEEGHIKGSVSVPSATFEQEMEALREAAKGKTTLVFHCAKSQVRGPRCANAFASANVDPSKTILVLENGFNGWKDGQKPICSYGEVNCTC